MKRRRIEVRIAVFLATLLVLSAPQTDQAFDTGVIGGESLEDTRETKVVFPRQQGAKAVKTELTGNVEVFLISVTPPLDGFEFQVNLTAMLGAADNLDGQIVRPGPEDLKVTNNSVMVVRLEITSVETGDMVFEETSKDGPGYNFQLVGRVSKVNEFGRAILVLGRADRRHTNEADFEQHVLYPGRTGIPVMELRTGESADLQPYGIVEADFYREYQFTAKPILKISAVRTEQHVWFK